METDEDLDALGRALLEEMERLLPTPDREITWEVLNEYRRHFYIQSALAVVEVVRARKLISQCPDNNAIR